MNGTPHNTIASLPFSTPFDGFMGGQTSSPTDITTPGAISDWPLATAATSRKFYPEYANASSITFVSGTLKVNGSAETSPYTHATGDYYEMTITSHATEYETDVTMTLLDDGVATSVFTVTTAAETTAGYLTDVDGNLILDADGNPIPIIV